MCEKSFSEKQNLLRHKENIHQDQSPKEYKQDFAYNASRRRKIVHDGISESSDNEEIADTEYESAYSEKSEEDNSKIDDHSNDEDDSAISNHYNDEDEDDSDNSGS